MTAKGWEGIWGGDGTVLYLDCNSGYMTVCLSKLKEFYIENGVFILCKLYLRMKKIFLNHTVLLSLILKQNERGMKKNLSELNKIQGRD